jgi:phosphohistidine phosphatase
MGLQTRKTAGAGRAQALPPAKSVGRDAVGWDTDRLMSHVGTNARQKHLSVGSTLSAVYCHALPRRRQVYWPNSLAACLPSIIFLVSTRCNIRPGTGRLAMKTLLLLRHAKSSWKDDSLADHDRPLNSRGKEDAPRMGRLIAAENLVPDLIVSSTAKRARKTAAAVAEHCGYSSEVRKLDELYLAPPDTYIEMLRRLSDDVRRVVVVGHNPGMQMLVTVLSGAVEEFPTAALAQVELPIDAWSDLMRETRGELVRLWRPRELSNP